MVTCLNGHENAESNHFCGECGAALPVTCPNGHQSPPRNQFCGECGAEIRGGVPRVDAMSSAAKARNPSLCIQGSMRL